MEEPREALHTLARRYCMERHEYWAGVYRDLETSGNARGPVGALAWNYTDEAYATFPRYLVWEAILTEVERLNPRSFTNTDVLRKELCAAGWRAKTAMTTNAESSPAACAAMSAEREDFDGFVWGVHDRQLQSVKPLPFRRVFSKEELQHRWSTLEARWGAKIGHYWWPLREGTPPSHLLAFHTDWFDAEKQAFLREMLLLHGVELVWEVREFGEWGCEQDAREFEPTYNGEEGYWTSSNSDWLAYASHESSITFAGEWLVRSFRQRFPGCDEFETW